MFLQIQDLVIMGIGCVFLIIWIAIFIASRKYDNLFEGLV